MQHGGERNEAPGTYTPVAYDYSDGPAIKATVPDAASKVVTQPDTMMIYPRLITLNTFGTSNIRKLRACNTGD